MSTPTEFMHFEDFVPGHTSEYGNYPVTQEDIVAFAARYDPQPMHLDDEAGRAGLLGGLSASGWHTSAILMRMNCDAFLLRSASMGGPGIAEMRWHKPVRPGDTLRARQKILEVRTSRSRPAMGLVDLYNEVLNQTGEVVMSRRSTIMFKRRHPEASVAGPESTATKASPPPVPIPVKGDGSGDEGTVDYLDDIVVGTHRELGSHTFERADMIGFAQKYDPQPFHVDDEAASQSQYGALIASGWQVAAAWMGKFVRRYQVDAQRAAARGLSVPVGGPSPGFRDLRWLRPTYAGDTLHFSSQVSDKRVSATRPGWGLLFSTNRGVNQRGELSFEFVSSVFWPRRPQ